MKRRLVRWTHTGYHGRIVLSCYVPVDALAGTVVRVSRKVARRLDRRVCGLRYCNCGDAVTRLDGLLLRVP